MSEKRRDSKGRILRANEFQRADGRYEYRYLDNGIKKSVYSWRLVESDKNPAGKRMCKPLRVIEVEVANKLSNRESDNIANNKTINDYFDSYYIVRRKARPSTKYSESVRYNKYIRNTLGAKQILEVSSTDITAFVDGIIESGMRTSTAKIMCSMLSVIFNRAIKDGIIHNNPVDDIMMDMPTSTYNRERRALTEQEQKLFVNYVRSNYRYKRWSPLITFMLGTGCRIGEVAALCWSDCDMQNGFISINKSLGFYKMPEEDKASYHIQPPKSPQSIRRIPIMPFVKEALLEQKEINKFLRSGTTRAVDGYSDFVFLTTTGNHIMSSDVDVMLYRLVARYNKEEEKRATAENREPHLLPKISAHILRHTFCTRLFENTQNIKLLQRVMGHASVQTTLDVYVSTTDKSIFDSFAMINEAMNVT